MSLFDSASLVVTPNGTKASKLYAIKPTDGSGDLSVTRATTATRVNSSGLIESVATNVPRLDYTNGTCPSILVEPQRTNLATYSDQFNNASYNYQNASVTANTSISPDGTTNADSMLAAAGNTYHRFYKTISASAGSNTFSAYVKAGTATRCAFGIAVGGGYSNNNVVEFDLSNGTISRNPYSISATITAAGNGWYRITHTHTSAGGDLCLHISSSTATLSNFQSTFNAAGTETILMYGMQFEVGSYATSYIPTVASTVTRNADVISKTGISSLIGQTEGTMFIDFYAKNNSTFQILTQLRNVSGTAQIDLRWADGGLYALGNNNGSNQFYLSVGSITVGSRYKIAIAYKLNDVIIYVNGVSVNSDNSATFLDQSMSYFSYAENLNTYVEAQAVNMSALFKTRLTNTELATLTTI